MQTTQEVEVMDDELEEVREIFSAAFASLGVRSVRVEYSGSGDSGDVDWVEARTATNEIVVLDMRIEICGKTKPLAEALSDFVFEQVGAHEPGWEINDGASGAVQFEVQEDGSLVIELEHTTYWTESTTSSSLL